MDPDGADGGTVVTDSLNGETKPDPAKLAQTAIIKQVSVIHRSYLSVCQFVCRQIYKVNQLKLRTVLVTTHPYVKFHS